MRARFPALPREKVEALFLIHSLMPAHNPPPGSGQVRPFNQATTGMMQPQAVQVIPSSSLGQAPQARSRS